MATESDDDIESIGEDVIGEDDNDGYETPPEIKSAMDDFQKQANNGGNGSSKMPVPEKSKEKYMYAFNQFMDWRAKKKLHSFSEGVFLAYFKELSEFKKPSTLWAMYSMVRCLMLDKHNIDVRLYSSVLAFLKQFGKGYKPKTSKYLTADQINKFLDEAPDYKYLGTKVAAIFGIYGACRVGELTDVKVDSFERQGELLRVRIPDQRTNTLRTFVIDSEHVKVVEKYLELRPKSMPTDRFFISYHSGKCKRQPIGKNKLAAMPRAIAKYLNLEEPERYTGHCFRLTSACLLSRTGATMLALKKKPIGGGSESEPPAGNPAYMTHNISGCNKVPVTRRFIRVADTGERALPNVIKFVEVNGSKEMNFSLDQLKNSMSEQGLNNEELPSRIKFVEVNMNNEMSVTVDPAPKRTVEDQPITDPVGDFTFVECKSENLEDIPPLEPATSKSHVENTDEGLTLSNPFEFMACGNEPNEDNDTSSPVSSPVETKQPENNDAKSSEDKAENKPDDEQESDKDEEIQAKRPRMSSKFNYFYETLFLKQQHSDVTIVALGKSWKLHKNMLCQSSYFARLFETSWKEGSENTFNIEITDRADLKYIRQDSLDTVFSSFYRDEFDLNESNVIEILATASFFKLDDLKIKCQEVMKKTISLKNVCNYYKVAEHFGLNISSVQWISSHFLDFDTRLTTLRDIPAEFMTEIVQSPQLMTPSEWHTYSVLKNWIFAQNEQPTRNSADVKKYYREASNSWTEPYLLTDEGEKFIKPFTFLKVKYLLLSAENIKIVEKDNILPRDWINAAYKDLWQSVLRIQNFQDRGPTHVNEAKFENECFQFYAGCIQSENLSLGPMTFQLFGLELEFRSVRDSLSIKRCDQIRSLKITNVEHNVLLRVVVYSSKLKNPIITSQIFPIALTENEEKLVMDIDKRFPRPLVIFFKVLVHTPL